MANQARVLEKKLNRRGNNERYSIIAVISPIFQTIADMVRTSGRVDLEIENAEVDSKVLAELEKSEASWIKNAEKDKNWEMKIGEDEKPPRTKKQYEKPTVTVKKIKKAEKVEKEIEFGE